MIQVTHDDLAIAVAAPRVFNRVGWNRELKYDGFRVLATNLDEHVRMISRKGNELGAAFPELIAELRTLRGKFALDCELVVLDHLGNPQFDRLATRARMKRSETIEAASRRDPAALFAFDALVMRGRDIRDQPLHVRKDLLLRFLKKGKRVRYLHHVPERGVTLYDQACAVDFEGVAAP